jgi:predicted TIM-barrel fold metal-dependent hydrolase
MPSEEPARPKVVDAQVHVYSQHSTKYPWRRPSLEMIPPVVTGDDMVAAMDAARVDAAIIVSPWIVYRGDTRYTESVYRAHPGRFRIVAPIDPDVPGVEQRVDGGERPRGSGTAALFAGGAATTSASSPPSPRRRRLR